MAMNEISENVLIKFAQKLAGNEKRERDRAVKKLQKWLGAKSESSTGLSREDFTKIWKGLHYCMWMSDKPLIQEELANTIANLIWCLKKLSQALVFVEVFFETECREWFGIDRLRLDKFMMLIRHVFQQALAVLKKRNWQKSHIQQFTKILQKNVLSGSLDSTPEGIKFHVADIYLSELDRACGEEVSSDRVLMFLEPYVELMTHVNMDTLQTCVINRIFDEIVKWEIEKSERATMKEGTSAEGSEAMEESGAAEEEKEEEEEEEPRHINIDYKALADLLFEHGSSQECKSKNRKPIYSLVKTFRNLSEGRLPKPLDVDDGKHMKKDYIHDTMNDLLKFENNISKSTKSGMKKRREKRKRKLKRQDETQEEPHQKKQKSSPEEEGHCSGSDKENGKVPPLVEAASDNSVVTSSVNEHHLSSSVKIKSSKKKKEKPKKRKSGEHKYDGFINTPKTLIDDQCQFQPDEMPSNESVISLSNTRTYSGKTSKGKNRKSATFGESRLSSPQSHHTIDLGSEGKKADGSSPKTAALSPKTAALSPKAAALSPKAAALSPKAAASTPKSNNSPIKSSTQAASPLFSGGFDDDESDFQLVTRKNKKSKKKKIKSGEKHISTTDCHEEVIMKKSSKQMPTKSSNDGGLISFTKGAPVPSAFLKRALVKMKTPNTAPQKAKVTPVGTDSGTAPGSVTGSGKKVIFAMNNNRSQGFKESLHVSPSLPFNPQQKPDQSILKCSPLVQTGKTPEPQQKPDKSHLKYSPFAKTLKKRLFKKRARAADFF